MTKLTESYLFARNSHNNVAALNRRIIHSYVILTFIFITINNSGRIICSIFVGGGGFLYVKVLFMRQDKHGPLGSHGHRYKV